MLDSAPTKVQLHFRAPSRLKTHSADALSQRPYQEECTHCHKVEAQTDIKQIRAIAVVASAGLDPATLRTDQLTDQDIGPILEEVETRQHPEWKDIADHSTTYRSYWAQWKSLAVRNGILEHHWEFADRHSKVDQIILPQRRVDDVLTELHGGP
jgi:hypothetical protein